ncbi:3-oxoacyl-[acyl-carrier-protein] synthase I, chloroplastic [Sarracenia purpurea var. burkii]
MYSHRRGLDQPDDLVSLLKTDSREQVMESLEHAMKRGAPIIAEYLGGAINCDPYHMIDPRADGLGVSSCIKGSLEDAGVSPEEVFICFTKV